MTFQDASGWNYKQDIKIDSYLNKEHILEVILQCIRILLRCVIRSTEVHPKIYCRA